MHGNQQRVVIAVDILHYSLSGSVIHVMAGQRSVVVIFAQTVCIDRSHLHHLLGLEGIPDLKALPSTLALVHNMVSDSKQQLQGDHIKACTEACKSVHFLGTTHLRSDVPRKCIVDDDQCVTS